MSKAQNAKRANKPNNKANRNKSKVVEISRYQRKTNVTVLPRGINQEKFLKNLKDDNIDICFGVGPAGSGKTLLATLMSIKMLKEGNIQKIVITRPNVAVDDRDIGFLPGSVLEKMTPWIRPILDIFEEYYSPIEIEEMIDEGIIEICPVAHLRGRTFKNAWILLDEAQGMTPNSMKSALTRIGERSKMIVTGDVRQSDLKEKSGLGDFLDRFEESSRISVNHFDVKDVERHPVVKEVLKLYGE